tara:strand:- start:1 stop:219 length:219 start_codon:yes stop_codon:yes gene_type:complete
MHCHRPPAGDRNIRAGFGRTFSNAMAGDSAFAPPIRQVAQANGHVPCSNYFHHAMKKPHDGLQKFTRRTELR